MQKEETEICKEVGEKFTKVTRIKKERVKMRPKEKKIKKKKKQNNKTNTHDRKKIH